MALLLLLPPPPPPPLRDDAALLLLLLLLKVHCDTADAILVVPTPVTTTAIVSALVRNLLDHKATSTTA
jgi:hypothetical protein